MNTPTRLWLAALSSLTLGSLPAFAGQFTVSPTRVALDEAQQSALVVLTNTGVEPVRFQVTATAWSQDGVQDTMETGTDDLVIFPSLLTLGPGESRRLRVGAATGFGATEGAYRVFVNELPPLDGSNQVGVKVLTRASIPVFLAPEQATRSPEIVGVTLADGRLSLGIANEGNAHFKLDTVEVSAETADGVPVYTDTERGWYVLSGNTRPYLFELPAAACAQVAQLKVTANVQGSAIEEVFPLAPSCDGGRP